MIASKFTVLLVSLSFAVEAFAAGGRIINPITDVCWSCVFPIKVAGTRLSASGVTDPATDAPSICTCGAGATLRVGINLSFFEPLRTCEVVRKPYHFPTLGGVEIDPAIHAPAHGRSARSPGLGEDPSSRGTAFFQAHWYHTPWLFILESLIDTNCLEEAPWDLAYLTELDPLWDDALASFALAPESAIFSSGAAVAACAADCLAASVGGALPTLFWCNGCQGSLYPLCGWVASMHSYLQAWHLIAARMSVKLAREGLLWASYGKRGQCGPYFEPIPRKDVWRTQLVYPSPQTDTCSAIGAATQTWGAGKTWPVTGEEGAVLLWRLRDCCQSAAIF